MCDDLSRRLSSSRSLVSLPRRLALLDFAGQCELIRFALGDAHSEHRYRSAVHTFDRKAD
jgi:hypothetical protein